MTIEETMTILSKAIDQQKLGNTKYVELLIIIKEALEQYARERQIEVLEKLDMRDKIGFDSETYGHNKACQAFRSKKGMIIAELKKEVKK